MTEKQKDKLAWLQERATIEDVVEHEDGELSVFMKESPLVTIKPDGSHYATL